MTTQPNRPRLAKLLLMLAFIMPAAVFSQQTILTVGMTTALSGPASDLGKSMQQGIETYFQLSNQQNNLPGKTLKLVALDDGYQPTNAARNMRRLINEDKVIAIIGNVGTPTAKVTVPIAIREKTLLFGAFTGANLLRTVPPPRYVINVRASYEQETSAIIHSIIENGIKPQEIAFFTQNDAYGDAGYNGAIKALKDHGFKKIEQLAHGRYARNTQHVEEGLLKIYDAPITPRAIVMVGAYTANAKFIKLAKTIFPDVSFYNVSFVGSRALLNALGKNSDGVYITQVVPHFNDDLPATIEYREALTTFYPEAKPNFVSLEGFLAAKIFVAGLKRVQGEITRESLIDAIESIKALDIGINQPISYSKQQHQALHRIWPTQIKNGKFVKPE